MSEMDLPASYGGMEYPGFVMLSPVGLEARIIGSSLDRLMLHEIAHQWFYSLVGNDEIDDPWLDEALAWYVIYAYYQEVRPDRQLGQSAPAACALVAAPRSEQGVADDFHRYVTAGVEPGISGRNNLETLAVCELLVRSARDHRTAERAELA